MDEYIVPAALVAATCWRTTRQHQRVIAARDVTERALIAATSAAGTPDLPIPAWMRLNEQYWHWSLRPIGVREGTR